MRRPRLYRARSTPPAGFVSGSDPARASPSIFHNVSEGAVKQFAQRMSNSMPIAGLPSATASRTTPACEDALFLVEGHQAWPSAASTRRASARAQLENRQGLAQRRQVGVMQGAWGWNGM